jgi:integrase
MGSIEEVCALAKKFYDTLMGKVRRRHTLGWIVLEKRASPQRWVAHWYLNESYRDKYGVLRYKQGAQVLGFKTKDDLPTKGAAQKRWEAYREEIIRSGRLRPAEAAKDPTFQVFVNERFIPVRRAGWNGATRAKLSYYFNLMCVEFGDVLLVDLDKARLQRFLNGLAERFCHDTVSGCYIYLKAVFAEAVEQRIISENPTKTLALPHTRDRDTYTVPFEDVQRLEDALESRDKVIFKLLSRCGPRAGEAFGFQWQDLRPDQSLRIQRTYSRSELKPPKTKKSRKPIYLPLSLYNDLQQLRTVSEDPSPTGWIFPSARKRRRRLENGELEASATVMPLDYHNWINRNLKPTANKLGIRVNCQIMRRTFATLANDVGGDLKDIQTQMRHSRSATTADIYVQPVPRSVRESMEALDKALSDRPGQPLSKTEEDKFVQ